MKLRTGDLFIKVICVLLIPFMILGSLIMSVGSIVKALGLVLMFDPSAARKEIDLIIRVSKNFRFY